MQEENKFFQTFFYQGHQIRTVEHNGETWWVANDVCSALEIGNVSQAINGNEKIGDPGLDDDEKANITILDTIGRKHATLRVNEPGLYHLINKSRILEAKTFGHWVRHEVLLTIRKTNSYSALRQEQQRQTLQEIGLQAYLRSLSKDELSSELHYLRTTLAAVEVAYNYEHPHLPLSKDELSSELHYLRTMLAAVETFYSYKYSQKNNFYKRNITIEPNTKVLLQHLDALDRSGRFDSRILFKFIQQEAKSTHTEWMNFIYAHKIDIERFGPLDIRTAPDNEEFAMLSMDQGCILLLLGYLPTSSSFAMLLDYLYEFRATCPANRFAGACLLANFSIERQLNKTLEEACVKEEGSEKAEKRLEKQFGAHLEAQGMAVHYQVRCEVGIADIVTADAIYELKASLSRDNLQKAVGQVLAYRACINPLAKAIVVGYPSNNGL